MPKRTSRPLSGVRVLDFTHLLPGEVCSTLLCDLGCTVLRVEPLTPGFTSTLQPVVEGESLYYWSIHRNKSRIGLDLKNAEGRELARRLIEQSDVLLENFRPGVMKKLGLGYFQARRLNKKLIYCSISGYGHNNSSSERSGHDLNFVAESGVLDASSRSESGAPVMPGALLADYAAAMYASVAVASALFERVSSQKGQHIDISMFEAALSTQQLAATAFSYLGISREQATFGFPGQLARYNVYACEDGRFLAVAALELPFWKVLCERIGLADADSELADLDDQALTARLREVFKTRTQREWLALLDGANCCVSPVNTIEEALHSAPARERSVICQLQHPKLGTIPQLASPVMPASDRRRALSRVSNSKAKTIRVLKELGYTSKEIRRLCADGVIDVNRHGA